MSGPERFAAWQPAVREYLDDFADGRADAHGYFYLVPAAALEVDDAIDALIIGHAGEGVTRFALRRTEAGVWSHNAIDDDWTWRAPTVAAFWQGWSTDAIKV